MKWPKMRVIAQLLRRRILNGLDGNSRDWLSTVGNSKLLCLNGPSRTSWRAIDQGSAPVVGSVIVKGCQI